MLRNQKDGIKGDLMKFKFTIFILMILLSNLQIVMAAENDYGIVKAWFDRKNATVEDIQLKIGQPVEVKVEVISKIKGDVLLILREPGVTKAFNVVNGPSKEDDRVDNLKVESGWSKTYTWTVAPSGAWKNGNAPINIFVQFNKGMDNRIIQFTIANPYILDEQYTGAPSNPTPQPAASGTPAKPAPFPSVLIAVVMLLVAWRWLKYY